MNRRRYLGLVAATSGLLAGCSSSGTESDTRTASTATTEGPASTTVAPENCPPADLEAATALFRAPDGFSEASPFASVARNPRVGGDQVEVDVGETVYEGPNGGLYRVTIFPLSDDTDATVEGAPESTSLSFHGDTVTLSIGMQARNEDMVLRVQGEQDTATPEMVERLYQATGCYRDEHVVGRSWV